MASGSEKRLYILSGCTAVGKTEAALAWAERNGAEIVSCDSLLFYRGMDLGTAKPTRAELARVPHHLIDICDLTDQMDIARYVALARQCVTDLHARGKRVLVTGGSGFYLKAFFSPVADDLEIAPDLRAELAGLSPEEALAALRKLNPAGLGSLDTANPRRVLRALERCRASGRTLLDLREEFARRPSPFADWELRFTRLDRQPQELARRIDLRVAAMLAAGLVDEVRRLLAVGLEANPSAARAIGYRETIAFLRGELSAERLADEISANTRALVKKQRTWFRTQVPEHRVLEAGQATVDGLFES